MGYARASHTMEYRESSMARGSGTGNNLSVLFFWVQLVKVRVR